MNDGDDEACFSAIFCLFVWFPTAGRVETMDAFKTANYILFRTGVDSVYICLCTPPRRSLRSSFCLILHKMTTRIASFLSSKKKTPENTREIIRTSVGVTRVVKSLRLGLIGVSLDRAHRVGGSPNHGGDDHGGGSAFSVVSESEASLGRSGGGNEESSGEEGGRAAAARGGGGGGGKGGGGGSGGGGGAGTQGIHDGQTVRGGGGGGGGWRGNLVKCLHAQLGDRLVRGASANPVGDLVLRRLEELGVPTKGTEECWRECAPRTQSTSPPPQGNH